MGQLNDQLQKLNSAQSEILTERKRKAIEKERKELLTYLLNKYKAKILEGQGVEIFAQFENDLKKYNFDKTTRILKGQELETFYNRQAKQTPEEAKAWQMLIVNEFERAYKKHGLQAFWKLKEAKPKILEILQKQDDFQAWSFYDTQNKRFFKEYQNESKGTGTGGEILKGLIFGGLLGVVLGYKSDKKKKRTLGAKI